MPTHPYSSILSLQRALIRAVRSNDCKGIQEAVAQGAELDISLYRTVDSPLIQALQAKKREAFQTLLAIGADPWKDSRTMPFMLRRGWLEEYTGIVKAGVPVDRLSAKELEKGIATAAFYGLPEVVRAWPLPHTSNVSHLWKVATQRLHNRVPRQAGLDALWERFPATGSTRESLLDLLFSKGIAPRALMASVSSEDMNAVRLMTAINNGHASVVVRLLKAMVPSLPPLPSGWLEIMDDLRVVCAKKGEGKLLGVLLKMEGKSWVDAAAWRTKDNRSMLMMAVTCSSPSTGTIKERLALVKRLVEGGGSLDEEHSKLLPYAVNLGPEFVRCFLNAGADPNARRTDSPYEGYTALHAAFASFGDCAETVMLLDEAGADWNLRDFQGETPLEKAAPYTPLRKHWSDYLQSRHQDHALTLALPAAPAAVPSISRRRM